MDTNQESVSIRSKESTCGSHAWWKTVKSLKQHMEFGQFHVNLAAIKKHNLSNVICNTTPNIILLCCYVLYMLPMIFENVVHAVNKVEQTKG